MKHRFGLVLCLILGLLLFQMAAPDESWSRAVAIALEGVILVVVFHASDLHPLMRRSAEAVAVGATIIGLVAMAGISDSESEINRVINVLVIACAPAAIGWGVVKSIRENQGVQMNALAGVLCIYLLFGMIFASLYSFISQVSGDPFFTNGDPSTISEFLYFSYTTLTTTGYGDLAPAGNLGRSLAIFEQLIGAVYLVTVVAVLVSNMRPRRP